MRSQQGGLLSEEPVGHGVVDSGDTVSAEPASASIVRPASTDS